MEEIWMSCKLIDNYLEDYIVSNFGRVYNCQKQEDAKIKYSKGFKIIRITKNQKTKVFLVHRLVAGLFLENPLNYRFVIFKDGNKNNCNATNLLWSPTLHNLSEEEQLKHLRKRNVKKVLDRRKRIKEQAVEYKGGSCIICGYNRCISALEFHHLNPIEKDFSISEKYTINWKEIKLELDKCILVCANCHREIEAGLINLEKII